MQEKYSTNTNCHCKILSLHNFVKLERGTYSGKNCLLSQTPPTPKKNLLPSTMKMMSTNCANSFSPTEKIERHNKIIVKVHETYLS